MSYGQNDGSIIQIENPDLTELSAQLADIANVVNVKDFGATPNTTTDQTPYIQAAVDHLISLGGGTLLIPSGEYRVVADANTSTNPYNPKRILISGTITGEEIFDGNGVPISDTREVHYAENIHIKGDKDTVIYMTGMTEAYLYNQDDIAMSNVDIFCAFTFRYAKYCSISNIKIKGDYLVEGIPFRYSSGVSQARAKAVSFVGCIDCTVHDIDARYILGNFVHVNTAARTLDGYWHPSEGISIYNNYFNTCLEIGVNLTTTVPRARVENNTLLHCNGAGIEGPAIIRGNTIKNCKGGGISPSADALVIGNVIEDVRDAIILTGTASLNHAQHINTVISQNFIKNIRNRFLYIVNGSGNAIITGNKFINSNLLNDDTSAYQMMGYIAGNSTNPIKNVTISDNYFEINNVNSFVQYGLYVTNLEDSFISNNTFNSSKTLTNDMYLSELKRTYVEKNKLTKGIGQSSTNTDRNIMRNNHFPTTTYPIEVDWYLASPPSSGDWKVGDFLKKVPSIVTKAEQRNMEIGWVCISTSPLTWEIVYSGSKRWDNSSPTSGSWTKGEIIQHTAPTYGGITGWVCLLSGTIGTLSSVTGNINTGESVLVVNTVSTLKIGDYINIAGVTGTKRIVSISGTQVTLNSTANATVTGAAVTFNAPTIAPFGLVDLQGSVTWNPGIIVNGQGATSPNIDFSYVALGDFVIVAAPYDLQGLICTAYVVSAGRVRIRIHNSTGADVTLTSGIWKVKVIKS